MNLKEKMTFSKIDNNIQKVLEKIDGYLEKTDNLSATTYGNMDVYSIILNEIYKNETAFDIWQNQIENLQSVIQELYETLQYDRNSNASFLLNQVTTAQNSAIKQLKNVINKNLEEKLGTKLTQLTNRQSDSLVEQIQKATDSAFKFLVEKDFSEEEIANYCAPLEDVCEEIRNNQHNPEKLKELKKEKNQVVSTLYKTMDKAYGAKSLAEQNEQQSDNFAYAKLVEFIASSTDYILQVDKASSNLKYFAKKNGPIFEYADNRRTARADVYFDQFVSYLYKSSPEENNKNRSDLIEYSMQHGAKSPHDVNAEFMKKEMERTK